MLDVGSDPRRLRLRARIAPERRRGMAVETHGAGPHAGLLDWLAGRHVEYELREHPETFTAEATARAEHLAPHGFAKGVGVATDDGRRLILLVGADDHVDLAKARRVLRAADVRVLTEREFAALAPDCEAGTAPPVPDLVGLPVYADYAIREWDEIAFHAGSHRFSVHVERAAWDLAAGVIYADLARTAGRPVWAR
jgi:prolyl-tRNA editing enzyme YbaK/EbsC (Cys-tRNA(Pro) deacylase)